MRSLRLIARGLRELIRKFFLVHCCYGFLCCRDVKKDPKYSLGGMVRRIKVTRCSAFVIFARHLAIARGQFLALRSLGSKDFGLVCMNITRLSYSFL